MTVVEFTAVNAHNFARDKHEHYVEPHWCPERLFDVETFKDSIWDPCCGFGRIPEAAAWLVFTKGHIGQPSLRWLRRDAA